MKVGIILTLHWSELYRPSGGMLFNRLFKSILEINIDYPHCFYIIDNQSEFSFEIPNEINHKYFYVKNQFEFGLTGAWNMGIHLAYEDGCDIIINSNDDVLFNNSLNIWVSDIINNKDKDISIFGPRTNKCGKEHPNSKPAPTDIYTYLDVKYGLYDNLLNGFCFAFTRNVYELARYTSTEFFPYTNEMMVIRDIWANQETYFSILTKKNILSIICNRVFVKHLMLKSWMHHHADYDVNTKQYIKKNNTKKIL